MAKRYHYAAIIFTIQKKASQKENPLALSELTCTFSQIVPLFSLQTTGTHIPITPRNKGKKTENEHERQRLQVKNISNR